MAVSAPSSGARPIATARSWWAAPSGGAQSARPLHVMHVVFALQPGGMEFGVVKLVNGLDSARVRSSICSTKAAGSMAALLAPGVALHELGRRDGNDPFVVRDLYRLFRRERPDIVHTHGWGTLIEAMAAARLARVPLVVHGEHGTLQVKPYQRWMQRRVWSRADRVLSVSSRLAEKMARETGFAHERIKTIRNGVDLTRFRNTSYAGARRSLGIAEGELAVGTVGRLVPVKDQATLLEAMAILRGEGLRPRVLLAGDGPLRESLQSRAAALGLDTVTFLGHRPDVENVLAALDVFVLSSVSEGLSNTILEAMASGVPVVSTRVGGCDELVDEGVTGLLVPSQSPRELAGGVARILRDPLERKAMGAAARRKAETEFSLETMLQAYETLYLELARSKYIGFMPHAMSSSAAGAGNSEVA